MTRTGAVNLGDLLKSAANFGTQRLCQWLVGHNGQNLIDVASFPQEETTA